MGNVEKSNILKLFQGAFHVCLARVYLLPALHTRLAGKGPVRFQSHFLFSTLVIIITKDTLPSAIVFHSGGVDVQ